MGHSSVYSLIGIGIGIYIYMSSSDANPFRALCASRNRAQNSQ
jgi:hypothetical protein